MKKLIFIIFSSYTLLFASDAITVDSLFKKNTGIRSVTSLDILTANNTRKFDTYPTMSSLDDGSYVTETRMSVLNQTFLYDYSVKTNFIVSGTYIVDRTTYAGQSENYSKISSSFDSLWLGLNYDLDTIARRFKPSLTFQTAVVKNNTYQSKKDEFYFKSYSLKYSIKDYSDPLVSTFSLLTTQNLKRKIGEKDIKLPDTYTLNLDLSLILNPKVSLNFGFENTFQTELKENNVKVNDSTIVSNMGFGVTYSMDEKNALTLNSKIGASANAPDNTLSISLWHKF